MDNPLIPFNTEEIEEILHGDAAKASPENDIFLIETQIAGTSHIENVDKIVEHINSGEKLYLHREPYNNHDEQAILVLNQVGEKLGYIPKDKNEVVSRLLDADKKLYAQIVKIKQRGDWHQITIKIFMMN